MGKTRATNPKNAPYRWIDHLDRDHRSYQHFDGWRRGLPTVLADDVLAQIEAREELAAAGRLTKGSTKFVEPVREFPGLVELKWDFFEEKTRKKRDVRQYHGEPAEPSDALVRVHLHVKRTFGLLPRAIQAFQRKEFRAANARFDDWCKGNTSARR